MMLCFLQVPNIDTLRKTNAASASHSSSKAAAAPQKGAGSSIANEAAYPPLPPEELFDDIVYAQATTVSFVHISTVLLNEIQSIFKST